MWAKLAEPVFVALGFVYESFVLTEIGKKFFSLFRKAFLKDFESALTGFFREPNELLN